MFALAIAVGSLAFVLIQHLTRAAWSVGVRRTAEHFAATLPVLAVLSLPIIGTVALENGYIYRWAIPMERATEEVKAAAAHNEAELEPVTADQKTARGEAEWKAPTDPDKFALDPLDLAKRSYGLHWHNPAFFVLRIIFYFVVWSGIALWYRRTSITQDRTDDDQLTLKMQERAAPCLVILGLTITGAAFDLLMSLDPHWYSTMFGVYYIANSFLASYATLILTIFVLQKVGYLRKTITIEHYHDLGKYLFGFTFFYGYIAFSQYMLMWYANIPEETEYMVRHGVSTHLPNGFSNVILLILFCHILIPFAGLMSRYPKRRPTFLAFWALWQLCFVAVDMYWLVMPEMGSTIENYYGPTQSGVHITVCAIVGFLGVVFGVFGLLAGKASLRPTHDPRLADSLVFQNI
jgi:hypothetical protein